MIIIKRCFLLMEVFFFNRRKFRAAVFYSTHTEIRFSWRRENKASLPRQNARESRLIFNVISTSTSNLAEGTIRRIFVDVCLFE